MSTKDDFISWLNSINRSGSASNYSGAINTISNELLEKGLITHNIYSIENSNEIKDIEEKYLSITEYRDKNIRGNNMYSAALRKYADFIDSEYYRKKDIATIPERDIANIESKLESITNTEKNAVVKVRIGQSLFKSGLIQKHHKCMLCKIDLPDLLIASHIKPWFQSNNREKTDLENGLLLCSGHDKLFDSGFITFDQIGNIVISNRLSEQLYVDLNIDKNLHIDMSEKCQEYMAWHRENIFK